MFRDGTIPLSHVNLYGDESPVPVVHPVPVIKVTSPASKSKMCSPGLRGEGGGGDGDGGGGGRGVAMPETTEWASTRDVR